MFLNNCFLITFEELKQVFCQSFSKTGTAGRFVGHTQIFIFSPNDSLEKLWNVFSISSKRLFLFSRYLNFCKLFPSFQHFLDAKGQVEVEKFTM